MKLTKASREFLRRNFWEDDQHIDQIEAAIGFTDFWHQGKMLTIGEALELCGQEKFLSAMDRSAFHRTADVTLDDGTIVHFDSRRFFRD